MLFGEQLRSCSCSLHFSPVPCCVHPPRAQTSPSTLSSNTLSQCSSLMYRPSSTPIQYTEQALTVFAVFSDSRRQDKIPERTVSDTPTVSCVPGCFVVALRIAGVVPQCFNWYLLSCIAFTRHEYVRVLGLLSVRTCLGCCQTAIPRGASGKPSGAAGSIAG